MCAHHTFTSGRFSENSFEVLQNKIASSKGPETSYFVLSTAFATMGTGDEGARISAADKKAGEQSERDQIVSEQLKREYGGEGAEATAEGLLLLLKELWASQCLEACVHLLGETPRIARYD